MKGICENNAAVPVEAVLLQNSRCALHITFILSRFMKIIIKIPVFIRTRIRGEKKKNTIPQRKVEGERMLEITLREGTELKIGDDVKIVFHESKPGRIKVGVEAPREAKIKRVRNGIEETTDKKADKTPGERGAKVFVVRNKEFA